VAAGVLADRLAAALVHHEPGWRLPRLTALARRYSVSSSEIDVAIDELAARHLVRRLPDGQVYRASPAEYWVPLAGVAGLVSRVDPMGGQLACVSRHTTLRRPPEDIGRTLGLVPGASVLAVRCVWTVGREPAALVASYLPERVAAGLGITVSPGGADAGAGADRAGLDSPLAFPLGSPPATTQGPRPGAVQIEMGLPPPSVARTLRLVAGEPVATVTVSFTDHSFGGPAALTMAMLRPELFRIVVHAAPGLDAAGHALDLPCEWAHAEDGWDGPGAI
jgi:UTRA domain/Bacterial regulatory proteins, gntR family